ncbi:MAG: alpha-amylase/4-alpha-glucanotransferase domain-containing protein [Bacteroidota bacterium]
MKRINLIIGIHNHQPIGNFDSVFKEAFDRGYQPFISLLEKHPSIKVALHYSGILLDWLEQERPKFLQQVARLVKRQQVEIMGGAYYEAILSIIPDRDKLGQLQMLSARLKKTFGTAPVGMWLAERVWEQHLASFVAQANLKYTVVDDTHFIHAGFSEEELLGYYTTEEQGATIAVFPISKQLRYAIPFRPVRETIDYLRSIATEGGDRIAVFADDGEKFGVWPKTFEQVYGQKWLEEFFGSIEENGDWINLIQFRHALKTIPPIGRTYLPNASYAEMLQWALPSHHYPLYKEFDEMLKNGGIKEKYEPFFKGGFWRNFLVKYPESNSMHKKALRVSARLNALEQRKPRTANARSLNAIRANVYAAECNDAYWHGVFGGLYLPVLREPIYKNLIQAERLLDKLEKRTSIVVETTDFNCDGRCEVIVESPNLNCYFKPHVGGSIFELDFKPLNVNVVDVVSRHEEGYHAGLGQGGSIPSVRREAPDGDSAPANKLAYDKYRHGTLIDHFFGPSTRLEDVARCNYPEAGDFVLQPYEFRVQRRGRKVMVMLERNGSVIGERGRHPVSVRKTVTIDADASHLTIDYLVRNGAQARLKAWFGVEFAVGLHAGEAADRYYYRDDGTIENRKLRSCGEITSIQALGLKDEWMGIDIRIEANQPASFWRFPIEVLSLSESGMEKIFQGAVVIPHWRLDIEKEWSVQLVHRFKKLTG